MREKKRVSFVEKYLWIGFIGAVLALLFAVINAQESHVLLEGNATMQKIAKSIREGANAYLKHQYTTVAKVFAVVFVSMLIIAFGSGGTCCPSLPPSPSSPVVSGPMLAGFIGMKIATNANARTAQAASEGLNRGLRVAFSSGSVMGFTVVGLGILDITIWFTILRFGACGIDDPMTLGNIMVMNGMGASFMALFARVGGGIYTKAADVGADLVGKVEAGIPEDDPRNPATIADNVGDNVGDVVSMGADLYESYVGSILSTFALGACAGYGWEGMGPCRGPGCVRHRLLHHRLLPGQNPGGRHPEEPADLPAYRYLYRCHPLRHCCHPLTYFIIGRITTPGACSSPSCAV